MFTEKELFILGSLIGRLISAKGNNTHGYYYEEQQDLNKAILEAMEKDFVAIPFAGDEPTLNELNALLTKIQKEYFK